MPAKVKKEVFAVPTGLPVAAAAPSNNNNRQSDATLETVTRIFSDVHLSSTTHGESKKKLLELLSEAYNQSNNNTAFLEALSAMKKVTLAACVNLDANAVNRHSKFLYQTFMSMGDKRVNPALHLINDLYALHNAPDEKTRHHLLSVILDIVRCLPDLSAEQTPPWFGDFVEVLKLRTRDKNWQVREKALHLLSIFNGHDAKDDITQFMFYIGAEETRTEVRKLLLKNLPPKGLYFATTLRFLDDKVSSIRKQAWICLSGYNWARIEVYAAKYNMVARVANGLNDGTKAVQTEVGIALKKWVETKEQYVREKYEHMMMQQQQQGNGNNNNHNIPNPANVKVSATELLDMLMNGLRNLLAGLTMSTVELGESMHPLDQPHYISTVADHLWREHDAKAEKKKQHRKKQQQQIQQIAQQHSINQQQQRSSAPSVAPGSEQENNNKDAAADDDDDVPLIVAYGANLVNDKDDDDDLTAPLPYPLVLDGMTVANLSMWAAHCRAAVAAGKTELEQRLLPPLRVFAGILSEAIEIFHTQFGGSGPDESQQRSLPDEQRGIRSRTGTLRIYWPCEAELLLHILIRTFMLYQEGGYLNHIDHDSSSSLISTLRKLLVTTMDPASMFCKEAMEALFAVCQETRSVGDPVRIALERIFESLDVYRAYGLSIEDSEGFGRYDEMRRRQLVEMQRHDDMKEAADVMATKLANDNLYMLRMQHVALEYLNCRSRTDRSNIPHIIDHVIRLGREWGEPDGEVREVATRALGMYCLANPTTVPTYIGLLIHNAAAQTTLGKTNNNNNNNSAGRNSHQQQNLTMIQIEAKRKIRLAAISASFDILCEFGPGFFKRQQHPSSLQQQQQNGNDNNNNNNINNEDDANNQQAAANAASSPSASFDVQQWDRYVATLQALTLDPDGAVRRLASLGVSKMLACHRFHNPDVLLCGMALVQLYYVSPTNAELQALTRELIDRRVPIGIRILQEKCQINHANDSFLFFMKAFSSSTPKRMKQTLDGGIIALRLLLRRARVSSSALVAATKFLRRLTTITDSCSLEKVRDIDPRIAEAAKERILNISNEQNPGNNNSNNNMNAQALQQQQQRQIQQLLMSGEGDVNNNNMNDPFQNGGNLSLPPLKDDAGNDLFEVAKSNPVLWTLLASHSLHETLAEFLLESIREGCEPVVKQEEGSSSAAVSATRSGRTTSSSAKKKPAAKKGRGKKQQQEQEDEDDQDDDDTDNKKEEDQDDDDDAADNKNNNRVKKEEDENDSNEDENILPPDTIACKMLCARSLSNLQLYKRDPASVTKMCGMILRTQTDIQQRFPDVAAVVNRFGLAYAKSCGRKNLGDPSDYQQTTSSNNNSKNPSARNSFNNNNNQSSATSSARNSASAAALLALSSGGSEIVKNVSITLLKNVLGKDGAGAWRKLTGMSNEVIDRWFINDLPPAPTTTTQTMMMNTTATGQQRRGRTASNNNTTGVGSSNTNDDESLMNAFHVSAPRKR